MKKLTVSKLKKKLDKIYSIYIRLRDCKALGYYDKGLCFTCGKMYDFKDLQCGHYIPRSHNNTRYLEFNTHSQCRGCNIFKSGAMDVYALALQAKYGKNILKKLNKLKNVLKQFTVPELETLIEIYEEKTKELQ